MNTKLINLYRQAHTNLLDEKIKKKLFRFIDENINEFIDKNYLFKFDFLYKTTAYEEEIEFYKKQIPNYEKSYWIASSQQYIRNQKFAQVIKLIIDIFKQLYNNSQGQDRTFIFETDRFYIYRCLYTFSTHFVLFIVPKNSLRK